MTRRLQSESQEKGLKTGSKMRWRSSGSIAAAAFLLASAPQAAKAQSLLRAPNMMVENAPHNRAPDFHARDVRITSPLNPVAGNNVRISAPITPLPVNDVPISAPAAQPDFNPRNLRISNPAAPIPSQDIRISSPVSLPAAYQPHTPSEQFNPSEIRISAPSPIDLENIRINAPVPGLVQAQAGPTASGHAVNANPVFTSGAGAFTPGGVVSSISGLTGQTIIDWTLVDQSGTGAISFLPDGNTLAFSGGIGFTVLNRIVPTDLTRGIRFDGNVTSTVPDFSNPLAVIPRQGGNVWFYSPGGIVVGGNARFDVGSLVLTTNAINVAGGLFGPSGEIRFEGSAASGAVTIEPFLAGSPGTEQINANNFGGEAYVALVAPRVVQGGNVDVDGSVAYVGAEQANLTINSGLFDISIGVGTDDSNGVVHTGTTTGNSAVPTPDDPGTNNTNETRNNLRATYLVSLAKNTAVTMLVGGDIGYRPATNANIVNGKVILSAGFDVEVGSNVNNRTVEFASDPTNTNSSNIQFTGGTFNSDIEAFASDSISAVVNGNSAINLNTGAVGYDFNLNAINQIDFGGTAGGRISADGDVTLRAGTNTQGGTINIFVDRDTADVDALGRIVVGGDLTVDAGTMGLDDFFIVRNNGNTGIGQDAVSGDINITVADGGRLQVDGNAEFLTDAQGGKGEILNGFAQSGDISVTMTGAASSINIAGDVEFDAEVRPANDGKIGGNGIGREGNDSVGGDINVDIQDGSLSIGGRTDIIAAVFASGGASPSIVQSNDATAGDISINFAGGTHNIGELNVSTRSFGGGGFDENGDPIRGLATGPNVDFLIDNATVNIGTNFDFSLDVSANADPNELGTFTFDIINGGTLDVNGSLTINTIGIGEDNILNVTGGSTLDVQNTLSLDGSSTGIFTASGFTTPTQNTTGDIIINVDNSNFNFGQLRLDTTILRDNSGGAEISSGAIEINATNNAVLTGGSITIDGNANNESNGGAARASDVLINVNNSSLALTGDIDIDANGQGNNNSDAAALERGEGVGGAIEFRLTGAAASIQVDDIRADADGRVVQPFIGEAQAAPAPPLFDGLEIAPDADGTAGLGSAGSITVNINSGTFAADIVQFGADGSGGDGYAGYYTPSAVPLNGGDGVGGDVTFNLNGGNTTMNTLSVTADGIGGDGGGGRAYDGTVAGDGGAGFGGNATFNAIDGTLTVTNTLTVSANGNAPYSGGRGGYGSGTDGGDGGSGTGGTATFNLDGTSTVSTGNVVVSTDGFGGDAGSSFDDGATPAGVGGTGGNGTGGDAVFNNTTGTISFGQLSVQSVGTGGNGGSNSASTGGAITNGGDGGSGSGGNATINLNQDDLTNPLYIVDASATGGRGGGGLNGGAGGDATAGLATININDANVSLDDPEIRANAVGGNGGYSNGINGNGGNGGSAMGGTARLQVTGDNGSIDLSFITQEANATGGNGESGYGSFGSYNGGNGGNGGNANGGTVELLARTGGTIDISGSTFSMTSTGTGGNAGDGGYSYDLSSGDGGSGGDGTGGVGRLLAQGGTLIGDDITITTAGTGGDGGMAGNVGYYSAPTADPGEDGVGGNGTGGTGLVEVQEGSPGIVSFNDVLIESNGTGGGGPLVGVGAGGRIEITDTSTDPAGLISLNSLTVNAFDTNLGTGIGSPSSVLGGFFVSGDSGVIDVAGDLTVNVAGDINYTFDGDGQMVVGGNADLIAGQNIFVSHTNNATLVNSIDVTGTFDANAGLDFNSMDGSLINAGETVTVRAERNATIADIVGVGAVDLSALQNVTVTNAAVTGVPFVFTGGAGSIVTGPTLTINAGYDPTPTPTPVYDPSFGATIDGNVTSTGRIFVNAGGNARFVSGSSTVSDNGLSVRTGDDIIVESGASVVAGANAATTPSAVNPFPNANNLFLRAGDLAADLISTTLTPFASIVAAGDINANDFAVVMSANAIDGLGGTITANSLLADINDAPANGATQFDDNGLLSAQCVQGNACFGAINATNLVHIGQNSN
ncbi:MAG: hypothetical protein ABJ082_08800, partial [Parasphingorhabdus sp.]